MKLAMVSYKKEQIFVLRVGDMVDDLHGIISVFGGQQQESA